MLFENEIFEKLNVGDRKIAYVKKIRKDGKLDLSLQPIGKKQSADTFEEKIVKLLKEKEGYIKVNSKSEAEEIMTIFGLSKKSFKRTLTSLISQKRVELFNEGIKLI